MRVGGQEGIVAAIIIGEPQTCGLTSTPKVFAVIATLRNSLMPLAWVDSVSDSNLRLIGILEVLIGVGLLLPQLAGILPWLTPLAAVGLVCTMIGALLLHLRRKDGAQSFVINIVLLLAAFVAYGRFVLIPA